MGREAPHFVDEAVLLHFALFWGNSWSVTLSVKNSNALNKDLNFAKIDAPEGRLWLGLKNIVVFRICFTINCLKYPILTPK